MSHEHPHDLLRRGSKSKGIRLGLVPDHTFHTLFFDRLHRDRERDRTDSIFSIFSTLFVVASLTMHCVGRWFRRLQLSSGVSKPPTLGTLPNFCTDGTPSSQTLQTVEFKFEGVKRPTTENSAPPLFHGRLNKFPAACHVFQSGEVPSIWYKMAKEDRDDAFIHPYFRTDQGDKVLIISKDVDYTLSNWVKANPSLAHAYDTRVMIRKIMQIMRDCRQNYGICASFSADSIFVVGRDVQMGIPVGWCEGVEGDISCFEALINDLYPFHCGNDFELYHLVSSMKPTVPEVDMERRLTRLLSHPWYLTSVDQNEICVEAWSMISKNNLGYKVGKEFRTIYRKHLGPSKLDWKQNFLKQPNGQSLKTFVANFDKLDKSDGMAFLRCSHICISQAIHKVGMTETDVRETLKNSFPEFMAILFETLWVCSCKEWGLKLMLIFHSEDSED